MASNFQGLSLANPKIAHFNRSLYCENPSELPGTMNPTLLQCSTFVSLKTTHTGANSIFVLPLTTQKYAK